MTSDFRKACDRLKRMLTPMTVKLWLAAPDDIGDLHYFTRKMERCLAVPDDYLVVPVAIWLRTR